MTPQEKQIYLTSLKKDCFACRDCGIGCAVIPDGELNLRPQVFSRGNVNAPIVLVGQNPGRTEIIQSKPFVGDAGKFLDKMISILELDKKHLYVTNAVKCYTPKNRAPDTKEIATCRKFLCDELTTIGPRLIVTLGNIALQTVTGSSGISQHRGNVVKSIEFNCDVFPLLHPASTLHNKTKYGPMMDEDLNKLKKIVNNYL